MARSCLILLLLVGSLRITRAESPLRCAVCQALISGQYFSSQDPTSSSRQPICVACSKLPNNCFVCKIPIRDGGRRLADGRWYCERDLATGIFAPAEAARVYEETWRDLQRILDHTGVLPRHNLTVSLVDGLELRRLNQSLPSEHDPMTLLGLTRTRVGANRRCQHEIYLISGLPRARLAAVCAHEYAHTWLHENVPPGRTLEHDTIEGFCELVAYKLMASRHEEREKKQILANAYTRGQVNALVQAEAEQQFLRVVQWIKTGTDSAIRSPGNPAPLALSREDSVLLEWPPPAVVPTTVPAHLVVKGITNGRSRRFVLINDCTLARNEEGLVRVGNTNVVIRCVEIREHSAIIRVQGTSRDQELFLGANED